MRILYHHRTRSRDGQAVHIEELLGALGALGHEIRIVAPAATEASGFGADAGLVAGLKRWLPRPLYEVAEFSYNFLDYQKLSAAARAFRPDVIYERYNLYTVSGVWLARRLGIPLLLEVNAPLVHERSAFGGLGLPGLARWSERKAWAAADVVLPVTQVLADMVNAAAGPSIRTLVIPNGVDMAAFGQPPDIDTAKARFGLAGRIVLGFTGFVREWHRVDRVLDVMASPECPSNVHLMLVGDGTVRVALQEQAARLGLADRVSFPGLVPRGEIPVYVAAFDIALQPHVVAYASPLKLFEYLALGRAVIAPDTPNIREVLDDGGNGLLFRPDDDRSFRDGLLRLINDPALRDRLGRAARATIDRRGLTWRHNAERVTALAEELLAARGRRPVAVRAGAGS
jgi:glycosyltransferase involved in cell wall biosynthesis